jgi:hypothetical protein
MAYCKISVHLRDMKKKCRAERRENFLQSLSSPKCYCSDFKAENLETNTSF